MANKTTKELEELAVKLMVTRKLTPKNALDEAELNYEPGTTGYNRVFGRKRRRLRALKNAAVKEICKKHTLAMYLMTGKKLTPQQAFEKTGLTYSVKDVECERLRKRVERNRKREEPRAKYHNLKSSFTTAAPPHSQPCRRDGGAGVLGGKSSWKRKKKLARKAHEAEQRYQIRYLILFD